MDYSMNISPYMICLDVMCSFNGTNVGSGGNTEVYYEHYSYDLKGKKIFIITFLNENKTQ